MKLRKRYITTISIAVVVALMLILGACGSSNHGPGDQQIVSSIDAKLYQNAELKPLPVTVTSNQGVVTLSGTVNAPLEKLAAEDVARKTDGVKQVVDHLHIASASAQAPPTAAPPSEEAQATPPPAHHKHHARRRASSARHREASLAPQETPNDAQAAQGNPPQSQDGIQGDQDNQVQDGAQPATTAPPAPAPATAASPAPAGAPASPPVPAAAPLPQTPQPAPAPAAPPPPQQVTVPAGTVVSVRMIDGISSGTAQPDQIYSASLFAPIVVNGEVVVPRGADARVRVVDVQSAGHFKGQPLLKVELVGFTLNGTKYHLRSDYYDKVGKSRGKNTAEKVGGGAGLGALLGAVIGHGKGAGIGAVIGAGAGAIDQKATHAEEVKIPPEAKIDFTLKSPVSVTLSGGQ